MKIPLIEEIKITSRNSVVNVSSVPQRSPFRYPGGKTWFVPYFRNWLASLDYTPSTIVEPFAGGGIISLTAVMEGLVQGAIMCELDKNVAAVWEVMLNGEKDKLNGKIASFKITRASVIKELSSPSRGKTDLAFKTILRNRVQRSGIMASGARLVRKGENGKGVASRWYPETLQRRINEISAYSRKICFRNEDGMIAIRENVSKSDVVFFVDPPYTAGGKNAGKRLYNVCNLDHEELFRLVSLVSGKVLMTYDDSDEIKNLARKYHLNISYIPMMNSHNREMNELAITN